MHCKAETTFISARFAHKQSIARTTDFPVDFFSRSGVWVFGVFFLVWLYLYIWKPNKKFTHLIIKISLRTW